MVRSTRRRRGLNVKSVFVHKKRLLQTCWMLRGLTIKDNMKGSSIIEGRNLKGYKARGVFSKVKKQEKRKRRRKKSRKSKTKKKAHNFFILYPNFKRKSL